MSSHPEQVCQYVTSQSKPNCAAMTRMLKAFTSGHSIPSLLPPDWKQRIERSSIRVTGDKATLPALSATQPATTVVKVGSQWLVDASSWAPTAAG